MKTWQFGSKKTKISKYLFSSEYMKRFYLRKSLYHIEVIEQLRNPNLKNERRQISKMLFFALESLYFNGINIYPNIIEQFNRNGFRKSSLYVDLISNITGKITKNTNGNVKWIHVRTIKKASNRDKNIILCFLLYIYHNLFIQYLQEFLLQIKSNEKNVSCLISKLQEIYEKTGNKSVNQQSNLLEDKKMLKEQEIEKTQDNQEKEIFDINHFINNDFLESDSILDFESDFYFDTDF